MSTREDIEKSRKASDKRDEKKWPYRTGHWRYRIAEDETKMVKISKTYYPKTIFWVEDWDMMASKVINDSRHELTEEEWNRMENWL